MTGRMIETCKSLLRDKPWTAAALLVAAGATATILGAYFFQYVVGLAPCPLCLEQRVPYYAVIPAALVVAVASMGRLPGPVVRLGLLVLAGLMIWGAGLGVYHSGAEWGFWQGPTTCAQPSTIATSPADLMRQLRTGPRVVDCTVAAWRFLGLSLAGWNVVVATILAVIALAGASRSRQA
jgi:disulfide bond formation protein DsbB